MSYREGLVNRDDIIRNIAKNTKLRKYQVQEVLFRALDIIETSVAKCDDVYIDGFGKFYIEVREPRTVKMPDGSPLKVGTKHILKFKPSKLFSERIKENTPKE